MHTYRTFSAFLLLVGLACLPGCLLSPFTTDVRHTQVQLDALEQRISRLEDAQPGGAALTAAVPPSYGETIVGVPAASAVEYSAAQRGAIPPPPMINWRRAFGKLSRGFVNVITGWVEIPKRMHETAVRSGAGMGWTLGVLRGFGYGFIRTAGGVYEVVTFPFPAPPDYRPIIRPEFVFLEEDASRNGQQDEWRER